MSEGKIHQWVEGMNTGSDKWGRESETQSKKYGIWVSDGGDHEKRLYTICLVKPLSALKGTKRSY